MVLHFFLKRKVLQITLSAARALDALDMELWMLWALAQQ